MKKTTCACSAYDELPLDLDEIAQRVALFKTMRAPLLQISQRVVERWMEHYRLYKCEKCNQHWQSALAPRDSDTWYLFKVPEIATKDWKESVYVSPGAIAIFLEEQAKFLANNFQLKDERCNEQDCDMQAMVGSVKCIYHQFLQIGFGEELRRLKGQRWFPPYSVEVLRPNFQVFART